MDQKCSRKDEGWYCCNCGDGPISNTVGVCHCDHIYCFMTNAHPTKELRDGKWVPTGKLRVLFCCRCSMPYLWRVLCQRCLHKQCISCTEKTYIEDPR
ncbi:hypothetical protein K469DRAFT_226920 [Zopfia rhizophila CBS 207.26]|uniref:Uncharacterized protein n=1 Tax=Zopfia rhizophila CBS 207.26 TaxID=1314779 RepID=A0A6A6DYC2_9PEZI|nr:hypothetical protein K469DRAFT_226920 [Zopfia rhizophila CBS 207.26]